MKPKLAVIKLGGNIIDDDNSLLLFLAQFSKLEVPKILVHGGGKIATSIGKQLGIDPEMINGRRVTNNETLKLVTMVYAGLLNKKITATLQSRNCNAFGLSGADGNLIRAKKRNPEPVDYGFVGDPVSVNTELIKQLLDASCVPVIAPITHDGEGQLLNTNADTIAESIASALSEHYSIHLVFAFEKRGVLQDVSNHDSLIPVISKSGFTTLASSGAIHSGMLPKLSAGFHALENGVAKVSIGSAFEVQDIIAGKPNATQLTL